MNRVVRICIFDEFTGILWKLFFKMMLFVTNDDAYELMTLHPTL